MKKLKNTETAQLCVLDKKVQAQKAIKNTNKKTRAHLQYAALQNCSILYGGFKNMNAVIPQCRKCPALHKSKFTLISQTNSFHCVQMLLKSLAISHPHD